MWLKKLSKFLGFSSSDAKPEAVKAVARPVDPLELLMKELRERTEDIHPSDVITFPEPLRSTINFAVRLGHVSLTELSRRMDMDMAKTKEIVEVLVARHLLYVSDKSTDKETYYETRLSAMTRPLTRPKSGLWDKLE